MRNLNKSLLLLMMAFAMVSTFTACEKDDLSGDGKPSIKYVRITNPLSADSLLIGAGQGNLIAIIGENLGDAVAMWFNNQPATLNPTYVTDLSILVSVPTPIPTVITNKLKIYFKNGDSLLHDFEVQISEPSVNSMVSEYVNTGGVATIRGDFFYAPLTVTFSGGVTGTLVSITDKILEVNVPAGAQPGPITVKTNFGETESDFWFRDNRSIFLSSDPFTGWWNASYVVTPASVQASDPPAINGNYIRFKKPIGAWSWNEVAGGPANAMGAISKNVPDEAILRPADYNLKFEVNTIKPYNNNTLKINVGLQAEDNDAYLWKPPFDTKGQWQTVIIPFEEVVASYKVKPVINPNGYWTRLLFHGAGDLDADISFDNFRIVPKVLD